MTSLLGSFNKLEADFDTPRAYNDYLEQVELLIYAKVYPDGGEEPKVSWGGREYTHEEHKRENAEEIRQNRRKRDDEKKARERKVAEEKERLAELHKSWDEEEMMHERDKQAKEERRIDDIVNKTPRSSPDPDRALLQQQQLQQLQQQQMQQMQRGHQHLARMYIEISVVYDLVGLIPPHPVRTAAEELLINISCLLMVSLRSFITSSERRQD